MSTKKKHQSQTIMVLSKMLLKAQKHLFQISKFDRHFPFALEIIANAYNAEGAATVLVDDCQYKAGHSWTKSKSLQTIIKKTGLNHLFQVSKDYGKIKLPNINNYIVYNLEDEDRFVGYFILFFQESSINISKTEHDLCKVFAHNIAQAYSNRAKINEKQEEIENQKILTTLFKEVSINISRMIEISKSEKATDLPYRISSELASLGEHSLILLEQLTDEEKAKKEYTYQDVFDKINRYLKSLSAIHHIKVTGQLNAPADLKIHTSFETINKILFGILKLRTDSCHDGSLHFDLTTGRNSQLMLKINDSGASLNSYDIDILSGRVKYKRTKEIYTTTNMWYPIVNGLCRKNNATLYSRKQERSKGSSILLTIENPKGSMAA